MPNSALSACVSAADKALRFYWRKHEYEEVQPLIELQGKVAVVTGSGRGIGRAIAEKLAELGASVIICDVNPEVLAQTTAELCGKGLQVSGRAIDIVDGDAVREFIMETAQQNGKIDILVNNAGINRDAMLHKMERKQWDDVIAVNLTGTYNTMQPVSALMREQKSGRIINISSASWLGNIGQANYAASKAGVVGLTKTAARELAKYQVTVNAICPGFIDTEMTRGVPEKIWEAMIAKIPMGYAGKPEEIAKLVAFLSSDSSSYITGEVINVGGGMIL
jgi:3-oxoacyl-(acyl-carrier-protein) reductase